MSKHQPSISGAKMISLLTGLGYNVVRQRGSHIRLESRLTNLLLLTCGIPLTSSKKTCFARPDNVIFQVNIPNKRHHP